MKLSCPVFEEQYHRRCEPIPEVQQRLIFVGNAVRLLRIEVGNGDA